jgi:hypothetical protein
MKIQVSHLFNTIIGQCEEMIAMKVYATSIEVSISLNVLVSAPLMAMGNSNVQSMMNVINGLQIILMIPLIKTFIPEDLNFLFNQLQFAGMSFSFLDIIDLSFIFDYFDYEVNEKEYVNIGIESKSFLVNQLNFLKVVSIYIFVDLILLLLYAYSVHVCK